VITSRWSGKAICPIRTSERHFPVTCFRSRPTRVGPGAYRVGPHPGHPPRLILCFADGDAARPFVSSARTWYAQALRDSEEEVIAVELPEHVRAHIREAQTRQYR
jgi:hypothetical protein